MRMLPCTLFVFFPFSTSLCGLVCQEAFVSALSWASRISLDFGPKNGLLHFKFSPVDPLDDFCVEGECGFFGSEVPNSIRDDSGTKKTDLPKERWTV